MPSKGLMIPGIASPKDRWSMRCEKLKAATDNQLESHHKINIIQVSQV